MASKKIALKYILIAWMIREDCCEFNDFKSFPIDLNVSNYINSEDKTFGFGSNEMLRFLVKMKINDEKDIHVDYF